ncbi:hypothetical protein [Bradyrhizobium erythrophlei]|uniref:Uncharacterized protein n=1 Tax=Bradyrhizobium erythrophlei TaxID=1437360 RepID=A0A1M5RG44_9BRAD|nr:hypothetical protein [Bradyrhizobium erythrophlei]SHH25168.1 hypothetical protein SAMN05444169_6544 [Bradyrhizobium erythrophlei]
MNSEIEAEPKREPDDFDHDAAIARVLARRRKKADQLFRFKEKQKRQRRWVPLRTVIDWLASFNSRGERTAPDNGKALLFTAEIWNAFCGRDIFTKFQLGSNELPWCIIEDAHPEHAISRFTRSDLLGASNDKRMLLALIKRLWVPRVSLLNLFQERRWPVAPWLEEPQSTLIAKESPASTKSERNPKRYSEPQAERSYASRRADDYRPTIAEDKVWAKANGYPVRKILKLRGKYENRTAGQKKISDPQ